MVSQLRSYEEKNCGVFKSSVTPARYRYLFLAAVVFTCSFFILSILDSTQMQYINNYYTAIFTPEPWEHQQAINNTLYTIRTDECTIPALQAFDESITKYVFYPKNLQSCPNSRNPLLLSNESFIWIQRSNLPSYKLNPDSKITCCYRGFFRPSSVVDIFAHNIDDRARYKECIYFEDMIEAMDEFVRVQCKFEDALIYDQYFLFVVPKPFVTKTSDATEMPLNKTAYNVVIMGIDAVSRLNFHRTMPKTLAFLKNKGAIELLGYNKVGDNTFPNLIPVLLGIKSDELNTTCWPNSWRTFDNCPFIWDWFKNAGFYTALAEDNANLGTFNYGKIGFLSTPTDYYLHTFMSEAESEIGNNKDFNTQLCMGDTYFFQVLLNYVEQLLYNIGSSKLFGFFWEITMSHDYLNYPMVMDERYEAFLRRLDLYENLDNTIMIFMSDHGIRWGDIRYTKQGRLEERLPLVHFLLPQSFKQDFNLAYQNLIINSRRLTTPFDIHETLRDLVDLNSITDEEITLRSKQAYANRSKISLFLSVPQNRTCKSAGIEDHWCTCHTSNKLNLQSEEAHNASKELLRNLNSLLRKHPECARLSILDVLQVNEMTVGKVEEKEIGWQEYMIVIRTTPGEGVFEATLRHYGKSQWSLTGTISRLNLHGDQSRCVHDYSLKLYCYCL